MSVRVLVGNSFHYRRGGDSAQFLDLIAQLEARGHEVAAFSMHHPENLPSRWDRYWAPYGEYRGRLTPLAQARAFARSTYSAESGRCMSRLIRDFEPQVVHLHSVHHQLTMSVVRACLAAGVPLVWTLHDYRTVCPASTLLSKGAICDRCAGGRFWHAAAGSCKSGEFARSLAAMTESYLTRMFRLLGKVDCYIAPSAFLAQKVTAMGLPARRIEVVPNPVEDPGLDLASGRLGRTKGLLLYVGRLSPEKGVDCLIQAIAGLEGVRLRVLGDGPEAAGLQSLARKSNVDAEFLGWVDAPSVHRHMAEAAVLCVPSLWYENCPGVVLEAMVRGLPVLAGDLGGLTELLDSGRAGWLAPPGDPRAWRDAISEVLADEPAAQAKAEYAIQRVRERHDPLTFVRRIEEIYSSLVEAS